MTNIASVKDLEIKGKKVLIRVDFNVPMDEECRITDDARIVKSLDTIRYCLEQGASLVLMSHLGRPKGQVNEKFSLKPVAAYLGKLLNLDVKMMPDCIGDAVKSEIAKLQPGEVALLENLRFHQAETENDAAFAKELASLADVYVNDAFGAAHRAHASTAGVTEYISTCAAGFLLAREIEYLGSAITSPERPFITILGGAKVSDKIKLISNLMEKADGILIGGAMAYTFYKVMGINIGNSLFEPAGIPAAEECLKKAKEKNFMLEFPIDRLIAKSPDTAADNKIIEGDIPDGWSGFDIGPKTVEKYSKILKSAKTIVWNGPVGLFEIDEFASGTKALAQCVAECDATTIIGGGDTAAAVRKFDVEDKMSHVSTGGGASLEFLEGKELPGIAALAASKTA